MAIEDTNHQVFMKFQQNWLKQEVGQFTLGWMEKT